MHKLMSGSLSVETPTVAIVGLPVALEGCKLVHLSDFHYDGVRLSEELLAEAIDASNAANPDLVLLTGDFVTDDPQPIHALAKRLKHLQSRGGTFAVLGNHDLHYRRSKAEIIQALSDVDIRVLWNQIAYPLHPQLALVGLPDFWSSEFNPALTLNQLDPTVPRIVLSHNPDSAEPLSKWRVDLQLSGHTHGGQVVLPKFGPVPQLVKSFYRSLPRPIRRKIPYLKSCYRAVKHWEWSEGFHRIGSNSLYVNRGLGTYLPGRFFCPPEVTVITLVSTPQITQFPS